MGRKRQRYTDQFRASAVVMLEAQGYPENDGALTTVARHLGIPHQTLSRWAREANNPAPPEVVQEKRADLKELLRAEIQEALNAAPTVRPDASYKDLMTGIGIMVDKLQLLEGKPTSRAEVDVAVSELQDITEDDLDKLLEEIAADRQRAKSQGPAG